MKAVISKFRKSIVFRKGSALVMTLPRLIARVQANDKEYSRCPPVLVNSLPKSGTHLLLQIARALPNTHYYGTFIAQRPSTTTRYRSQKEVNRLIDRMVPGEVVPAHLHYSPETAAALERRGVIHLFIYRDPEAVILSEVAYLTEMAPWNALHRRFLACRSMEERVGLAIEGDGTPEYPNAAQRFAPFMAWQDDPNVVCVTYENLMATDRRNFELHRIAETFLRRTTGSEDGIEELVERMACAINPKLSHTSRLGRLKLARPVISADNQLRLHATLTSLENRKNKYN